jgi:hypothetical protein
MLSTDFQRDIGQVAVSLFARWSQENFFQYMGRHYGLDRLIEYGTEPLPETTVVVNPAWRQKDQQVRRERAVLVRQQAQFGAASLPAQGQPQDVAAYEQEQGKLLAQLQEQQTKLQQLKQERKEQPRHITLKDLPAAERFGQLRTTQKHLVDTIHLIAYRAETALVALVREKLCRSDDGRALVRQVFESSVDLRPNHQDKTLTVRLHRLSSGVHDQALEHLCAELTATETVYPGTDLRLIFEPVRANQIPRDQES